MKFRVKGNERLIRDSSNFAILNTDRSVISSHEYKANELRKRKLQEEEINKIKNDISEIKDMMKQLMTTQRN